MRIMAEIYMPKRVYKGREKVFGANVSMGRASGTSSTCPAVASVNPRPSNFTNTCTNIINDNVPFSALGELAVSDDIPGKIVADESVLLGSLAEHTYRR